MIKHLAPTIPSSFPVTNRHTKPNHNDNPPNIYEELAIPQAQRLLYKSITETNFQGQLPTFPTNIKCFLPSILSPLKSIALHNLPRSHHSNRIPNYYSNANS
jgi:hypothetical protein